MIKQCAWCGKFMGRTREDSNGKYLVTHGMCPDCFDREMKKLKIAQEKEAREQSAVATVTSDFSAASA